MKRTCSEPDCGRPHRAKGLCATHYNQQWFTPAERHRRVLTSCAWCGIPIWRRPSKRYRPTCSVTCRSALTNGDGPSAGYDWAKDAAKRATDAGCHVVEVFDRWEIFERDGWRCQICGVETTREPDPYDGASPTVDHIVPLSAGGDHSRANVRLACMSCNSARRDLVAA